MTDQDEIIKLILDERGKQNRRWGSPDHNDLFWNAILNEEIGEIARAILTEDSTQLATELVQAAAVIVAWLENQMPPQPLTNPDE